MKYLSKKKHLVILILKFIIFNFGSGINSAVSSLTTTTSPVSSFKVSPVFCTAPTSEQIRTNIETRLGKKIYCENSTLLAAFDLGVNFQSNTDIAIKLEQLKEQIIRIGFILSYISGNFQATKEAFVRDIERLKDEYLLIIKDIESLKQSRIDVDKMLVLIDGRINLLNESVIKFVQELGSIGNKVNELDKKHEKFDLIMKELIRDSGFFKGTMDQIDRRVTNLESSPFTMLSKNSNFFKNLGIISLIGYPVMLIANKKLSRVPLLNRFSFSLESIFRNILLAHIIFKSVKLSKIIRANLPQIVKAIKRGNRALIVLSPLMISYLILFKLRTNNAKVI